MNLLDKLIRVEYELSVYDKNNNLIETFDLNVTIEDIKKIIVPIENDIYMSTGYFLNESQANAFQSFVNSQVVINTNKYDYFFLGTGIYNW
jgi:hypothetical protein